MTESLFDQGQLDELLPPHGPGCKVLEGSHSWREPGQPRYICVTGCPRQKALAQRERRQRADQRAATRAAMPKAPIEIDRDLLDVTLPASIERDGARWTAEQAWIDGDVDAYIEQATGRPVDP